MLESHWVRGWFVTVEFSGCCKRRYGSSHKYFSFWFGGIRLRVKFTPGLPKTTTPGAGSSWGLGLFF